jgi:predicted nucleic acid-binding protein
LSRIVIDASVALAWCFDDEASDHAEKVLAALRNTTALVPTIWAIEIANGILVGERRRRINSDQVAEFLELVNALSIVEEGRPIEYHFNHILLLARKHQLSSYDACYIDLALRHGLSLATQDAQLKRVAETLDVPLFPA